ncbi:MAG: DUF748 domain-containing protein [Sulfurimonas sp.]|uniref:DUF748 domain-containing protein n=1 Tax=Sulfurimonas sp. TaxID=2022749 RepID=UPI0025CCBC6C|nr:DUF748 domain-containing protein [Sulfurimonas sp.]MCK9490705.1 DUF748 domain-containing protein [Sulfurimonas sp.]
MFKKTKNILLFLFVTYALVGFFAIPLVLKSQLKTTVEQELNAKLSIKSIYFNPFSFRLIVDEIALKDLEQKHLLSFESLDINLEPSSLYKSAIHIKSLLLQRPKISLVYNKDKTINFASLLKTKKQKNSTNESAMPRILLDKISIAMGCLDYEDYTNETPFEFSFENIGFNLEGIDTKNFSTSDATIRFYTSLGDGGFLDIKSQLLSLEPFEIKGSVEFEASKLYSQWKYFQDYLNLEVADGKVDFKAQYYFNLDDLNATTIDKVELYADRLRVKPKNKHQDILNLEHFVLSGVTIKPMLQDIHIKNLALESLHLKVQRKKGGEIDWSEYVKTSFAVDASEEKREDANESKLWTAVVDEVALEKIKLDFMDENVNVETKLNDLNLYVKNLNLAGVEALTYELDLRVNEEFICKSSGEIKHDILDVKSQIKCSALDIVRFKPYIDEAANDALSLYDLNLKSAIFGFDANLSLMSKDEEMLIDLRDANLDLSKFSLYKTSTNEKLLEFDDFGVKTLRFDSKTKEIDIEKTILGGLNIFASIYKDGTLNLEGLVEVKASENTLKSDVKKNSNKKGKDFRVRLEHFAINDAGVSFKDRSLDPALKTKLDKINVNLYKIDSKENSWLKYDAKARLNHKGTIGTKGDLQHTPLKQKSDLKLSKISLSEFSPYLQKTTYLDLKDAYLDLSSKIEYEKRDDKADLRVYGLLGVKEFFLHDSRDGSTLLSFSKMQLNSFEYEMNPDRIYINELVLDAFYVKAIIDKQKVLNLATLVKESKEDEKKSDESKLDFKIMKLNIASGSAKFEDLSLPLEFKTDIHDLNGVVYAISNQDSEISYVDIAGEVDKYGSTKLSGSVDSANPKSYLDLDFNFRNLELNALSGYSANFAGYKINEGKLFLDLGYKIVDSKLLGKNSIIIKKIKLGEEIEDENVTTLPLGFAIALLEDSDGVIDIDMPVEGNVDDPDFKYGAMVLKTFANLIVRAVASPFKFLGSMMGLDGEKLEYIEFEAGLATLLPPEREKLDSILKIMLKRPKISLKITPQYDETQDAFLLKREKLLLALMKKSGAKSKKEQLNSLNIDLLEDLYEEIDPELKLKDIEKKLKESYSGDILKREYLITLLKLTTNNQEFTQQELDDLATQRGEVIREYLVDNRALSSSRLIVEKIQKADESKENWVKLKMNIEVE